MHYLLSHRESEVPRKYVVFSCIYEYIYVARSNRLPLPSKCQHAQHESGKVFLRVLFLLSNANVVVVGWFFLSRLSVMMSPVATNSLSLCLSLYVASAPVSKFRIICQHSTRWFNIITIGHTQRQKVFVRKTTRNRYHNVLSGSLLYNQLCSS